MNTFKLVIVVMMAMSVGLMRGSELTFEKEPISKVSSLTSGLSAQLSALRAQGSLTPQLPESPTSSNSSDAYLAALVENPLGTKLCLSTTELTSPRSSIKSKSKARQELSFSMFSNGELGIKHLERRERKSHSPITQDH